MGVLAVFFLFEDVGVAGLASFMAREVDGAGSHFGQGVPAVVAVPSKALWNEEGAEKQDEKSACDKECRQTKKVSGILESMHGRRRLGRARRRLMRISGGTRSFS